MRVISGSYKGRKIHTLSHNDTRPTTDKVRENIFNILGTVEGDVLDLFAGSGALGIEAISRGADSCIFIDGAKDAVKILKENTEGIEEDIEIYRNDYRRALKALTKRGRTFDLIFLDPPYRKNIVTHALSAIKGAGLLNAGGRIVVETGRDEQFEHAGFDNIREVNYGTVKVTILKDYEG
ncbi:16S rRNA (guanine(966)-N(2))-methyltransferase RsmD [Salinicoccus kekensis]|uniref:16S rRNA (Guanine(966)-N(2))-methyltransferase RsmD n=1 Tax=Salinicoccus kekensis TaxID=714307 RepID=A0A285U966_9STAP|nr:16S rRNA (guanine(966)-N(2))-methyltransferase RsmD [Salinicoccus kekensis]SOC37938.1 16S rRNA (guanine(966)-N(2))-methyltransferase RsmD [Salinicoccus kekensis]